MQTKIGLKAVKSGGNEITKSFDFTPMFTLKMTLKERQTVSS